MSRWVIMFCVCVITATQDKIQHIRDEEVKQAYLDINLQHSKMAQTGGATMGEPNVHIDNMAHIVRAKRMIDMNTATPCEMEKKTVTKTAPTTREPPTFTLAIDNKEAKEGQVVKFEVNFVGYPTPEVQWYREGVEIQPSRDFQITNLYMKSFLLIPEVFLEDAGTFTCRAINDYGMAECRAVLNVIGKYIGL